MIVCPWKELRRYATILPGVEEAVALVENLKTMEPGVYPLENGGRVMVQRGTTVPAQGGEPEAHRKFLDIQYIVKGQEVVGWAPVETLIPTVPFSEEKDVGFYTGHCEFMRIGEGYCYVVFPEDAHMPSRHLDVPNDYEKIVVKLKV